MLGRINNNFYGNLQLCYEKLINQCQYLKID